ncbi:MAG: 3'-5' exoribonuclease YhaM family protein [Phycisphaerae bacterium]
MDNQHIFIVDLKPGMPLEQTFLVREKELRTTKKGGLYLSCTLADKSGTVPGRMWQVSESIANSIPAGGFLQVKGRTEDYRGSLQFIIDACRPIPADRIQLDDYLACSPYDPEEMWSELLEILRGIKNKPLRLLIKKFVEDKDFVAGYKRSPAAMQMHHPYIAGLLEHTLGMARAARALLPLYPKLNADLVLAGVFLHDMGKTAELTSGTAVNYTVRGQLVGHITMAAIWVERKAALVADETGEPFPQQTIDLLQHLILSHHGVHEYGSPKLPAIPEAYFLHYIDNLDAKMFMTLTMVDKDTDPDAAFTTYNRALETRVYKHSQTLPQ